MWGLAAALLPLAFDPCTLDTYILATYLPVCFSSPSSFTDPACGAAIDVARESRCTSLSEATPCLDFLRSIPSLYHACEARIEYRSLSPDVDACSLPCAEAALAVLSNPCTPHTNRTDSFEVATGLLGALCTAHCLREIAGLILPLLPRCRAELTDMHFGPSCSAMRGAVERSNCSFAAPLAECIGRIEERVAVYDSCRAAIGEDGSGDAASGDYWGSGDALSTPSPPPCPYACLDLAVLLTDGCLFEALSVPTPRLDTLHLRLGVLYDTACTWHATC